MRRAAMACLAALLVLTLPGCKVMQRISEGAYRNAVADGAVAELRERGFDVPERPDCTVRASGTDLVRVNCTGRTGTGRPVTVEGIARDAGAEHPRETYVIAVDGREVLRQDCLGLGCR
ncbi:hypothetical protein [Spirillospora albida]|uniref:hypothetical protein n=1 Tax=Spirillospora albida TaxID=58123 RepID=UPI0004BF21E8|nr:hypothetical protein [Spirillospora albida]